MLDLRVMNPVLSAVAVRWQQQKPGVQRRGGGALGWRQSAHDAELCLVEPVAVELGNGTEENFVPIEQLGSSSINAQLRSIVSGIGWGLSFTAEESARACI